VSWSMGASRAQRLGYRQLFPAKAYTIENK
jgi:hypothetical protein